MKRVLVTGAGVHRPSLGELPFRQGALGAWCGLEAPGV